MTLACQWRLVTVVNSSVQPQAESRPLLDTESGASASVRRGDRGVVGPGRRELGGDQAAVTQLPGFPARASVK